MSGNLFNYLALLAALVVGYGIFIGSVDSDADPVRATPMLQGYHLRDAVITETTASGTPHFRIAAFEVTQNLRDNSVELAGLRVDYLKPTDDDSGTAATAHWVLNADRGTAFQNFRDLKLRDNVQAHNLGSPHAIVLDTASLDVDMVKQTVRSDDFVDIAVDGHKVNGQGLSVDLNSERVRLDSNVGLRLAQAPRNAGNALDISLPDTFQSDSFDRRNDVVTMTAVRSKVPPFIEADRLRASGADLANNRVELRGAVKLELPNQGRLTADIATVTVRDNRVAFVHVTGDSPGKLVEFQHVRKDNNKPVEGRAAAIDYDVARATLHLSGGGEFSDEHGKWEVHELEYNMTTGDLHATNNTFRPKSRTKNAPVDPGVRKDQTP